MQITYLGHACFQVTVGGKTLLFDPFITPNPLAHHIKVDQIHADYVLISHGHGDHIADAAMIARRCNATLIAAFEITEWFKDLSVEKLHPMNTGGKWTFDFGTVKCVAAQHSSTLPDGTPGGNPLGFLITTPEGSFYYSGDTALTYDMKLIRRFGSPDFAFLSMGDNFTMGYEDAVIAAEFIGCQDIIAMHYDTFPYIRMNHEAARAAFAAHSCKLSFLEIGQTVER
jgi:L-ascorbate metabolism protein UlaG (beta-lactamase superfamily)